MAGNMVRKNQISLPEAAETGKPHYHRVLIKLSGEALASLDHSGTDPANVQVIALQIKEIQELGVQIAVVVGGGNIIRGVTVGEAGFDRATGDYMGMLSTVINALALQNAIEKIGTDTRVLSAIHMAEIAEPFIRRRAIRHLEKGRVVILAGGTGNPYFSTDTAAALRAMEIRAEVILKATKVDGVYDSDPSKNKQAKLFKKLSHLKVLEKGLRVMDTTAVSLCMDNGLPIIVFNFRRPGSIKDVVLGKKVGSMIMN